MTDLSNQTGGNGAVALAPAAAKTKRRIATASFDGHVGKIEFTAEHGGETVEIDATKIAGSIADVVKAYGAVNIMQTSYNTSNDPVGAAKAMVKRLYSGDWRPGIPRRVAEPEVLTSALATHLQKPPEYIEEVYLPAYAKKHGIERIGDARRKLRAHPVIADLIAKITAERAAQASQAARKSPREALDLTV